jgi:hypothetical protein
MTEIKAQPPKMRQGRDRNILKAQITKNGEYKRGKDFNDILKTRGVQERQQTFRRQSRCLIEVLTQVARS